MPDEADQHSLVFSSGSAGGLKGLVISRKGVEATLPPIIEALGMRPGDRLLLFLPMSNFQQRNMCYAALWYDFDIIITDYTQLFAAMPALNPTVLIAPPVLYQMMHAEYEKYPGWKKSLWSALGALLSLLPSASLRQGLARILFQRFLQAVRQPACACWSPAWRRSGATWANSSSACSCRLCESYGMVEAGSLTYRPRRLAANMARWAKLLTGIRLSFEPDGEIIVNRDSIPDLALFPVRRGRE